MNFDEIRKYLNKSQNVSDNPLSAPMTMPSGLPGKLSSIASKLVEPTPVESLLNKDLSRIGSAIGGAYQNAVSALNFPKEPEPLRMVGEAMQTPGNPFDILPIGGVNTWLPNSALLRESGIAEDILKQGNIVRNKLLERPKLLPKSKEVYSALKPNADFYDKSLDFETVCRKGKVLDATIEEIQKKRGLAVPTPEEYMDIREAVKNAGETVPCAACYVKSRQMRVGAFTNEFINKHPEVPKDYFLSQEGLDRLKIERPELYKEYGKFVRPRAMAKATESYSEMGTEILDLSDASVNKYNSRSGLRWQSWSDFQTPHVLDGMDAITQMNVRGLKGHAYTKQPEFVEIFGNTGLKINMSLIPKGNGLKNGKLVFDDIEGMPFKRAMELRIRFPKTAGAEAIGVSDDHIKALLASPDIDYVIPYHSSGMPAAIRSQHGMGSWKDYSKFQHVIDNSTGKAADISQLPLWAEHNGNKTKYLDLLAEKNLSPSFPQFVDDPNYMKLVTDFKFMHNGKMLPPQKVVEPNFDTRTINSIISKWQKSGGSQYKPVESVVKKFTANE